MLRRPALLLAVLVATLLLPAPAGAGTWSHRDARRDVVVTGYDPEPPPCGTWTDRVDRADRTTDIVRVGVRHTRHRVRLTVWFRDVRPRGSHATTVYLRTQRRDVELTVSRLAGESGSRVDLMTMPDYDAVEEDGCGGSSTGGPLERCRGLRARLDHVRDRVVVVVPRACLGSPRWVRAGVSSYRFGDGEAEVVRSDRWEPRGASPTTRIDGPYGPRVRVG